MTEFKITPTPRTLDTYSGDVERVASGGWTDDTFALVVETVSAEGYSVPVRLTFDRQQLAALREAVEITRAEQSTTRNKVYDHDARPDDMPEVGNRCKECGEAVFWNGHDPEWMHVNDQRNG